MTTGLNLVMVLPSLSSDTQIFKAMHEYDKTESSDGFVIVMLKHIHMFKAFNEYDDKTGSSGVFVIHHLLYTLICSKQWTNMVTRLK